MGQKGQMMPMQMPQMLGGGMAQNGRPMQMQFPGQRPPMMGYPAPQMMQNPMMKVCLYFGSPSSSISRSSGDRSLTDRSLR